MSSEAWEWLRQVEIHGLKWQCRNAREVLMVLAHNEGTDSGIAHPGRKQTVEVTGLSERTVDRTLEVLILAGALERMSKAGKNKAAEYEINLDLAVIDLDRVSPIEGARTGRDRASYEVDRASLGPDRASYEVDRVSPIDAPQETSNKNNGTDAGDLEPAVGPPDKKPDDSWDDYLARKNEATG